MAASVWYAMVVSGWMKYFVRYVVGRDGRCGRRSWARNGHAMETSEEFNRTHADGYHITMPYVADDELVNKYIS